MKYITKCKDCIFSNPSDANCVCEFYIINELRSTRPEICSIEDNYYSINNYVCKYGFSKNRVEEIIPLLKEENLREYIVKKNYVKYYLVIDTIDTNNSIEDIVDFIKNLSIKPKVVSIIVQKNTIKDDIDKLNNSIPADITWRLHNFAMDSSNNISPLHTIMSTNKHIDDCDYIWVIDFNSMKEAIKNKHIDQINFIVNVSQPTLAILAKKNGDYYDGLFLTKNNYFMLTQTLNQDISLAITDFIILNNATVERYD